MLVNFTIQNYKSIKDKVTLSFEATASNDLEEYYINNVRLGPNKSIRLLKLGLIYGANASGKTTILEALDFLQDLVLEPFEKKNELFDFKPFLFDNKSKNENSFFSIEFIQNGVKYIYEITLNYESVVTEYLYYFNPNKALVYKRNTDEKKQLTHIEFGSKIKINKEHKAILEANTLSNNTVLGGYLKTNFESYELQETTDWFTNKLKTIIEPRTNLFAYISGRIEKNEIKKSNVIELLKKADFNISDIIIKENVHEVQSDFINFISKTLSIPNDELAKIRETGQIEGKEIHFKHTFNDVNVYTLPYEEESAGTQRYYQFSGLLDLMIRSSSIFPIDELESSLHPDLLKHFILTFLVNSKNSQLIATTHLRELLMEKDIFRNDAIWFTEKQDSGSTDLYSLADFDSTVIRNTSSVYNAYKVGKLGATPNLNDYYIDIDNE